VEEVPQLGVKELGALLWIQLMESFEAKKS
jgi:hypothetical protein